MAVPLLAGIAKIGAKKVLAGGAKKKGMKGFLKNFLKSKAESTLKGKVTSVRKPRISKKVKLIPPAALSKANNLSNQQKSPSYIGKALMAINAVSVGIWNSLKSRKKAKKEEDKQDSLPERDDKPFGSSLVSGIGKFLMGGVQKVAKVATRFFGNIALGIGALLFVKYIDEIIGIFKAIVKTVSIAAKLTWGILKFFAGPLYRIFSPMMGKKVDEDAKYVEMIDKELNEGADLKKYDSKQDVDLEGKEDEERIDDTIASFENEDVEKDYNEGGFVSGPQGTDKIPAKLTSGEFVMSTKAVNKYGVDTLANMNAAAGATNKPTPSGGYNEGGYVAEAGKEWGDETKNLLKVVAPQLIKWMTVQNEAVNENPEAYGGIRIKMDRDGKVPNFGEFIANMSEYGFNEGVKTIQNNDAIEPEVKEALLKKVAWVRRETLENPNFKSDIAFDINKDIPGTAANRILIAAQEDQKSPAALGGIDAVERARLINRREKKNKLNTIVESISKSDGEDDIEEIQVPVPPTPRGGSTVSGGNDRVVFLPMKLDKTEIVTKQALYQE